jgi:hypothetical protein
MIGAARRDSPTTTIAMPMAGASMLPIALSKSGYATRDPPRCMRQRYVPRSTTKWVQL